MSEVEFFKFANQFLCEDERVSKELIEKHWIPESDKPLEINRIFERLCDSAQNMQMAPNVVSKSIGGIRKLSKVTNNFDVSYMVKTYGKEDYMKFFESIRAILNPTGQLRLESRSVWPKFCKAVIDGAHYLNTFGSHDNFYTYADKLYNSEQTKNLLPFAISFEIRGIGVALACDFLKEIGYIRYGKPDVHLLDILIAGKFLSPEVRDKTEGRYQALRVIDTLADKNNLSPYAIDKTLWLIGSGKYYKANLKLKNRKREFVERLTSSNTL